MSTIFKQQNSKNAEKYTVFQRIVCFNIRLTGKLCEINHSFNKSFKSNVSHVLDLNSCVWSPMMTLGFDWSLIHRAWFLLFLHFVFLRKYFLVHLLYDPSRKGKHPILYQVSFLLSLVEEKKRIFESSLCILLTMIDWSSTNSQIYDIWHLRVRHH